MKLSAKFTKSLIIGSCLSGICVFALTAAVSQTINRASAPAKKAALPNFPTGENLAKCLSFSKPVKFKIEKMKKSILFEEAKPIWAYSYSADKQTLSLYTVELYKARSLFGKKRNELEKILEKQERERKPYQGGHPELAQKVSGVETRLDGRKVYFATLGFGPGGAFQAVFTTIGDYDIAFTQIVDFEDDMPQEKRIKNPATAKRELPEAFKQLEAYIPNLVKSG